MNKKIFLSPPHMAGKELEYIKNVFESNYIAPLGEYVNRFEESITDYTGAENALAVSSGTAAIHLALKVLGIKEGDDVLVSTFTFIGSVAPVLYERAIPIFIDSDKSWQLSPELLREYLQKCTKKPKALIVTHLYGMSAKINEIAQICKEYDLYLIEDAAESLGATYEDRYTGTYGDFGIYSFNGNKILTTSGGGVLVSKNKTWIEKARYLATQAKEDYLYYEHKEYGFNYRMSNVLAAIGVGQMEVIEERVEKKRKIFSWYQTFLEEIDEIVFMPELENSNGTRWLTTLIIKNGDPLKIIANLQDENIESRPLWKPMHMQPLFSESKAVINGLSEDLFTKGICLPSGTQLKQKDVKKISGIVKRSI